MATTAEELEQQINELTGRTVSLDPKDFVNNKRLSWPEVIDRISLIEPTINPANALLLKSSERKTFNVVVKVDAQKNVIAKEAAIIRNKRKNRIQSLVE